VNGIRTRYEITRARDSECTAACCIVRLLPLMTTTSICTKKQDSRILAVAAFVLFFVGLFVPFLCMAFYLHDSLLYPSGIANVLALIFGILAWQHRLAKIAAIGAALICVLAIVQLVLFYATGPSFEREMKSKMEQKP